MLYATKQRRALITDSRHKIGTVETMDWRPDLLIEKLRYDASATLSNQHLDNVMARRLQHARHRNGLHQMATPFSLDYKQHSHG